jgi:hypothetical protein
MTKTCPECGLPPDLCNCENQKHSRKLLESMCPISEREKCEICGKICYGLMYFASHVAQIHQISATEYWKIYGHKGDKNNGEINPSRRKQT